MSTRSSAGVRRSPSMADSRTGAARGSAASTAADTGPISAVSTMRVGTTSSIGRSHTMALMAADPAHPRPRGYGTSGPPTMRCTGVDATLSTVEASCRSTLVGAAVTGVSAITVTWCPAATSRRATTAPPTPAPTTIIRRAAAISPSCHVGCAPGRPRAHQPTHLGSSHGGPPRT